MNRAMLAVHLERAEEHVLLGERHIRRQRQLIADLDAAGDTTSIARDLLATFEALQRQHEADRDRLRILLDQGQRARSGLPAGGCLDGAD